MERNDTMPIFHDMELFDEIIENSSFNERFNTSDFEEILTSSPENQKLISDNRSSSPFKNVVNDLDIKIENTNGSPSAFTTKKVLQLGNDIYLVEAPKWVSSDSSNHVVVLKASDSSPASSNIKLPSAIPSLSLQPWEGNYDFKVKVETATHSNNKWAYSNVLKKLFLKPFDSIPIAVQVSSWINGHINITPVFIDSQFNSQPVNRCHNHKLQDKEKNLSFYEHIVQVDNPDASYRSDRGRHSVDIPLGTPAPGESLKLLYVKCGCWNTCVGGPDRKQFCLVFTLFSSSGQEIGRQILDLKVCACPKRDCGYSENGYLEKENPTKSPKIKSTIRKRNSTAKSSKKIKSEPCNQNFELISVPCQISTEVKRYVNLLMAEKFAKENEASLPFPDV